MKDFAHDGRHAFQVLDALAREADIAGILPVDVHGLPGSATEFVAKVIYYITAREKEIDKLHAALAEYTDGIHPSDRSKPVLNASERAAVARAIETLNGVKDTGALAYEKDLMASAHLRRLLERMSPPAT